MIIWVVKIFLYSLSVYSCHLFLISSASVRSIPFLSFIEPIKRCPFHYRGLECKSRTSRNTWSNMQIWPWDMEWSRAKTNRILPKELTSHSQQPLTKTQEKTLHMDITRWWIPKSDGLYSLRWRWRSSIQSAKTRPGADCGSDHQLLVANLGSNWRN